MLDFMINYEPLQKGFWYVALISSLIFVIQSIMTFVGGTDMDSVDVDYGADFDGVEAPFHLFSFRNLINFLLGFGWTGVVFYPTINNQFLLVALATGVGLVFIFVFFFLIKQLLKLSEDNTFQISNLLHQTAQVYIPIPEKMKGMGRVQISYNGTNHELDAMTEDYDKLSSGTTVIVEEIKNNILIVKKIK